ncbi:hypothetical protein AGDE_12950 [Angomonas deanei]|uniref:FHA domain-containing protein n=1 Tax=Angomonas deanei TaxID=59799 RepID=A0A7G2CFU7_9TRYP|nr:hypothetical protein AGDE_12950 [Angomonas deanei]CAD2218700.1 hypothetical protein, conserved [Angomonas deanei]|eukprot:EPY23207.1 hypothetical protein AGDE_12950 [Angomonas deanei]
MAQSNIIAVTESSHSRGTPSGSWIEAPSSDRSGIVSSVISRIEDNALLFAFTKNQTDVASICKNFFFGFTDNAKMRENEYNQIVISYVEGEEGDIIQYRCDRRGDIEAVVDAESSTHTCGSINITTVTPGDATFYFSDRSLTIISCGEPTYSADHVLSLAETTAISIGRRLDSIFLYCPSESQVKVDALAALRSELEVACADRAIGRNERTSSSTRFQDIRAWSQFVGEQRHFSPIECGPYFISLNPKPVLGEKLVHRVCSDISYIVGDASNASRFDFVILPPSESDTKEHRSVYSPHCRLRMENSTVHIRPECGLTYINGVLLAEETALADNDRIILGKHTAFRYCIVGESLGPTPSSRILDWEMCSKEFRDKSEKVIQVGQLLRLESENKELLERCETLHKELKEQRYSCIILHNPPPSHKGQLVWSFHPSLPDLNMSIGPTGDIKLPFLTKTGTLLHEGGSLVYKCNAVTIRVANNSRFILDGYNFSVFMSGECGPEEPIAAKQGPMLDDSLREMKLSYFDLQWAIALLFDFSLPLPCRNEHDKYGKFRGKICHDHILKSKGVPAALITSANLHLADAVRMIGSVLSEEINGFYTGSKEKKANAHGQLESDKRLEGNLKETLGDPTLSAELINLYQKKIGDCLVVQKTESLNTAPSSGIKEADVQMKLSLLKGLCSVAAMPVTNRISNVLNVLSLSANPKALWEKYLQSTKDILHVFSPASLETATSEVKKSVLFSLIDFSYSTDFCFQRELLTANELSAATIELDSWVDVAANCVKQFKGTAWRIEKHGVTMQRCSASLPRG